MLKLALATNTKYNNVMEHVEIWIILLCLLFQFQIQTDFLTILFHYLAYFNLPLDYLVGPFVFSIQWLLKEGFESVISRQPIITWTRKDQFNLKSSHDILKCNNITIGQD